MHHAEQSPVGDQRNTQHRTYALLPQDRVDDSARTDVVDRHRRRASPRPARRTPCRQAPGRLDAPRPRARARRVRRAENRHRPPTGSPPCRPPAARRHGPTAFAAGRAVAGTPPRDPRQRRDRPTDPSTSSTSLSTTENPRSGHYYRRPRRGPVSGRSGIRTHGGPKDLNGFRGRPIRPLWHPSGRGGYRSGIRVLVAVRRRTPAAGRRTPLPGRRRRPAGGG